MSGAGAPAWPPAVTLCEVGPRDGFQMEKQYIPTDDKVQIVNALSHMGLREIQVTSFVHPKAIPQLADAEEVMARIDRVLGVTYSALVANARGASRAVAAEVDRIDIVVSATDSHSLSNVNMTTSVAMDRVAETLDIATGGGVSATIGFATALGCPFEGFPDEGRIEELVGRAVEEYGFRRVSVADTVGMADPGRVRSLMSRLGRRFPETRFSLHLHDTRRMGLANIMAGLESGIDHFDSSIAGLGGCPYAPGATGNVATEDVLNMLALLGVDTGIDLERTVVVAREVQRTLGHGESAVLLAGPSISLLGAYAGGQAKIDD